MKDPRRIFSDAQARYLLILANGKCQRCGKCLHGTSYHVHHVKPHSLGGVTEVTNGQVVCPGCHKELHSE